MTTGNAHNYNSHLDNEAFTYISFDRHEEARPPILNDTNMSSAQVGAHAAEQHFTSLEVESPSQAVGHYPPSYDSGTTTDTLKENEASIEEVRHEAIVTFLDAQNNHHVASQPLTFEALETLNYIKRANENYDNVTGWIYGPERRLTLQAKRLSDSMMAVKHSKPSVADTRITESSSWTMVTRGTHVQHSDDNINAVGAQFDELAAGPYSGAPINTDDMYD